MMWCCYNDDKVKSSEHITPSEKPKKYKLAVCVSTKIENKCKLCMHMTTRYAENGKLFVIKRKCQQNMKMMCEQGGDKDKQTMMELKPIIKC